MVAQLPEECFALVTAIEKRFLAGVAPSDEVKSHNPEIF